MLLASETSSSSCGRKSYMVLAVAPCDCTSCIHTNLRINIWGNCPVARCGWTRILNTSVVWIVTLPSLLCLHTVQNVYIHVHSTIQGKGQNIYIKLSLKDTQVPSLENWGGVHCIWWLRFAIINVQVCG